MKKNISALLTSLFFFALILGRFVIKNDIIQSCFGFLMLYFILLGYSSFLSSKFNKQFYETIPFSFILIVLILTIFGILNLLILGTILVSILGLTLFIFQVYNKKFKYSLIIRKELLFFNLIYIGLFAANYFVAFNVWDEYTYWSIASKNFYYSNTINFSTFNTMPNDIGVWYPPNPTILQYYFMKVFGSYRQGFELLSSQMLGFSLLLPLFKFSKNKTQSILISIICICIPAIFCESLFYNTIYVDTLLGLITAYGFINIVRNDDDKFSNISILLSIVLACITKSSGFMFSFCIILFYVVYNFFQTYSSLKQAIISCLKNKYIYIFALALLIPLIGWRLYCNHNVPLNSYEPLDGSKSLTTVSSIGELFETIVGATTGYNYTEFSESIENSTENLLVKKYYSSEPFALSTYNWIIIFLGLIFVVYVFNKNKSTKSITLALLITIISYLILLELSYLFMFDLKEAINHNSAQRYIGSILVALFILCIYYVLDNLSKHKCFDKIIIFMTLFVTLFTPINAVIKSTILSGSRNRTTMGYLIQEKALTDLIMKNVSSTDELLSINQGTSNSLLKIIYFATPFRVMNMQKLDDNLYNLNNFEEKIKETQYLLIIEKDEFIEEKLNEIFEYEDIKNMTLYKNNNGKLIEIKE